MARTKIEMPEMRVDESPNWRRYKDTCYWISKTGEVKRRCLYFDKPIKGYWNHGKWCFYVGGTHVILGRAVYEAFRGTISPEQRVIHKNKIKTDNRLENLQAVSLSESGKHSQSNRRPKMIINDDTKEVYENGLDEAAEKLGYTKGVIGKICNGNYRNKTDLHLRYLNEEEYLKI